MTLPPRRVALVGAGSIADVHAAALRSLPGVTLAAVVDPVRERAAGLARRFGVETVLADPGALDRATADLAHVLVPPPLHRPVAEPLLRAGLAVLLEKPMAVSVEECEALEAAAAAGGAALAVNHNFVHHPAFARLLAAVAGGAVGRVEHVDLTYIAPLRQLAAGQLGHWMFRSPANLLLEQAVHPLSQLDALLGAVDDLAVVPEPPRPLGGGRALVTGWRVAGTAARGGFTLTLALGRSHPCWRVRVVGSDGVVEADLLRGATVAERPTPWLDPVDDLAVGLRAGAARGAAAARGFLAYGTAQLGLRGRADGFFASMRGSIADAHGRLLARPAAAAADPGRRLVGLALRIAAVTPPPAVPAVLRAARAAGRPDVLLLGGTGFIGRHLTAELVRRGHRVAVLARQIEGLPAVFADPAVGLVRADVTDRAQVEAAAAGARAIVHLAHGGGGDWAQIERAMVGGARLAGEVAAAAGIRLVFASSIAALYLGDPAAVIDVGTPPDPQPLARGDYARGKVAAEAALRALAAEGLALTIARPGVVVGRGTSPFHSGIGVFNRETHCLGWNAGSNPLPLVLADDVAAALAVLVEAAGPPPATVNLVGDVRLCARDYVAALARATGRPLRFHPGSARRAALAEAAKWAIKRVGGRPAPRTTLRDLRSRGLVARFDTAAEKAALGWAPETDPGRFVAAAFADAG